MTFFLTKLELISPDYTYLSLPIFLKTSQLYSWSIFSKLVRELGTEVWTAVLGSGHRSFQNLVSLPIIKIVVHPKFANYDNDMGKHQRHVTIFVEKCRHFCLFWITHPTKYLGSWVHYPIEIHFFVFECVVEWIRKRIRRIIFWV